MPSDWKSELAAAVPALEHHSMLFYAKGAVRPAYNNSTVSESLAKFRSEMLPLSPLKDPLGKPVSLVRENFPKLVDLEHRTLSRQDFNASSICDAIEQGLFDCAHYQKMDRDRLECLFWLPEVICDPDAIYNNGHKIVAGHHIYVKVYDKKGSSIKVAFTLDLFKKGKIIRTVPITSFLTDPATAISFVRGTPLYRRK
jgi:hypothetical protein